MLAARDQPKLRSGTSLTTFNKPEQRERGIEKRTLRAQSRARRIFEATWREARNVWILLKLTFVDEPSTPRERARRLRHEETEAERFLWARFISARGEGCNPDSGAPIRLQVLAERHILEDPTLL